MCPHSFTFSLTVLLLQRRSWVVKVILGPTKPKIFTIYGIVRHWYLQKMFADSEMRLLLSKREALRRSSPPQEFCVLTNSCSWNHRWLLTLSVEEAWGSSLMTYLTTGKLNSLSKPPHTHPLQLPLDLHKIKSILALLIEEQKLNCIFKASW